MQSTPTKKQATQNGILFTPEGRRDPNDMRGSMALATPEELKAQLASRPRSVRSAVSQGYSFPSRASLSATRSEPELGNTATSSSFYPTSPSPSPSHSQIIRPQGLMPLCDTFSSPSLSPSNRPSYDLSTSSIFESARKVHESYLINWSPGSSSTTSNSMSTSNSRNSSPRKRGQMDDEEEGIPMYSGMKATGLVGARAYNDNKMDEDGDATMMMEDGDLPLSRTTAPANYSPTLSFGTTSGSNSASSSISSFGSSNNDPFSSYTGVSSARNANMGGARQVKTLPRRQPLGKTQSLPVHTFMNHMNGGSEMQLAPDIFNAEDGF